MPILVKDYNWDQSDTIVHINLPLKGVKSADVTILNSKDYCKVNICLNYD